MISCGTLRSVIEYGLPLPFLYNSYVGDSVRIRHLRFSTITHASVSRAREARLTAFVTQSGDVFNEDARLTIESSAKTPAVVVGRSRGRVAQRRRRRERVCRAARRTEVELIDRTTPYNSAPRRGLFYAAAGGGAESPTTSFANCHERVLLVHGQYPSQSAP